MRWRGHGYRCRMPVRHTGGDNCTFATEVDAAATKVLDLLRRQFIQDLANDAVIRSMLLAITRAVSPSASSADTARPESSPSSGPQTAPEGSSLVGEIIRKATLT